MEEAFRSHLVADAGVSPQAGERVVWGARPQDEAFPCIVLHRITGARDHTQAGRSGLVESLVQVDCWAETWLAAKTLGRAVVAAMDSLTDAPFQRGFVENERDTVEADADGRLFHRTMIEVRVWHADAV